MSDALAAGTVEGGNYEVIQRRLQATGDRLQQAAEALNARRAERFGTTGLTLLGHERIGTDNNSVAADIVQLGGDLLLGYNVFLGLKRKLSVADMLSLHGFTRTEAGFAFGAVTDERRLAFLQDRAFLRDFDELCEVYKDPRLVQLRVVDGKLLAVVRVGHSARDVRVFRWAVDPGGRITYLDARGERDHTFPPTHDFAWTRTTRDDHVVGRHPHVNVLDTVFVETVGGDLTVKIEDNTEDGRGIWREPVDDPRQSLDDADIQYAKRGNLVLLKVKPYGEAAFRYLVYNPAVRQVVRVDALGHSCASLPDDHGLVFPGGLYLATGELKAFDTETEGLQLVRTVASPNGEDVLYVFFRPDDGLYALYPYNLVRQELDTPILAHGWSLLDDGTLVAFRADPEPTRLHPAQIWSTPFVSAEHHRALPNDGSLLMRIGNQGLVRCVSDAFTLVRQIRSQRPTRPGYEALVAACQRFGDAHAWAGAEVGDLRGLADEARRTAERVVDEFDKVVALERAAAEQLAAAEAAHARVLSDVQPEYFREVDAFVGAMNRLRVHRGRLITLRDVRYVDVERLDALEAEVAERTERVGREAVRFLAREEALQPLRDEIDSLVAAGEGADRAHALAELGERLVAASDGVAALGEVVAGLDVEDATAKTAILERIGEVAAHANRGRAVLDGRVRTLRASEGRAEFGAQLKLLTQRIAAALASSPTPEACDEQLSRVLLQLEELEGRFGDVDDFLPQLAQQREELVEAFEARKQTLLEERQRRAGALAQAADRILEGVARRARAFRDEAELAAWFAADPMVDKVRKLARDLATLGETVRSDEIEARLKTARQDALRGLRDALELFDADGTVRFGKHRFTVNTRPLDLTLLPHGDALALHLTGTDFLQPIDDPRLEAGRPHWHQALVSEDEAVYRASYLAYAVYADHPDVSGEDEALVHIRAAAAQRYDEGYDRGVHDHDAARILVALADARRTADLLAFGPAARALAALCWAHAPAGDRELVARAQPLARPAAHGARPVRRAGAAVRRASPTARAPSPRASPWTSSPPRPPPAACWWRCSGETPHASPSPTPPTPSTAASTPGSTSTAAAPPSTTRCARSARPSASPCCGPGSTPTPAAPTPTPSSAWRPPPCAASATSATSPRTCGPAAATSR
ncbi:MAG: DNA repair ATPase [Myxococcota bacterium]